MVMESGRSGRGADSAAARTQGDDSTAQEALASAGGGRSPVYGYLRRPSMVDYPGQLAVVLFTAGCNFRCGFCHNPELTGQPRLGMSWPRLEQACDTMAANWVDAAVVTGGEPTMICSLPELLVFLRARGFRVKLDTNGSNPDLLARCLPLLDYVAMDIKTGLSEYAALTGFADTGKLRDSMQLLRYHAPDYELRTTLIEPIHGPAQLQELADMVRGAHRYVLQPFVPGAALPDPEYRAYPRTSPQFLLRAREVFEGSVDELVTRGT